MRRFMVAMTIAVVGGLLLALAFPPAGLLRPLALSGPLLLALAVRGLRARTAYFVAFIFGMAFFIPHIAWAGEFLGWLPWTALAVYQSVFMGLLGPALVAIFRLRAWPVWAACAWVGVEALRSRYLFGGFPWGRLGFSQDAGPFTPWVAYGGVPLLSAVVALCGANRGRRTTSSVWPGRAANRPGATGSGPDRMRAADPRDRIARVADD